MNWKKLGLVIDTKIDMPDWGRAGALTPTPFYFEKNDTIRIFCGFRNAAGISRIGYVDVSAENPKTIIKISEEPVLELGRPGSFDDNGQILGHLEKVANQYHMYYVGFQLVNNVKFLAFTGLAVSNDLECFEKVSESPVLDRRKNGLYINAIHSILPVGDGYLAYHAMGNGWQNIEGKFFPQYEIYETFSSDGVNFSKESKLIIPCDSEKKEYRIGRPSVFSINNELRMFFTKGTITGKDYFPGMAKRKIDGSWIRCDEELGLSLSDEGFDNRHLCYPRYVYTGRKHFIFYNGNNMGEAGFGVAELIS